MSDTELQQIMDKLNSMEKNMATKDDLHELRDEFYSEMDSRFEALHSEMDSRFNEVDARFNEVDARFNKVDDELQVIREQVAHNSEFEPTIKELKIRIDEHDQDLMIMKRDLNRQKPSSTF